MSGLPLPNWNGPPFRPSVSHNGFMQGNQMQMNAFCQANVPPMPMSCPPPFPHFMPGFRPHFQPPPFHPGMMQGGAPPRVTKQQRHGKVFNKNSSRTPGGPQEPSAGSFSCDACSRDFTSQEILNTHLECHVQCNHSGCTFKASSKVLKVHVKEVHEKGTLQVTLDTPEEIAKWREQRKRRYPTVANVAKKGEEAAKRRASGQVLQTKNYRYQSQRGGRNRGRNRSQRGRQNGNVARLDTKSNQKEDVSTSTGEKSAADGDPLSLLLGSRGFDDSDTEAENPIQEIPDSQSNGSSAAVATSSTSALASLCSSYGNMSSDEDDSGKEDANNNNNNNNNNKQKVEEKQPEIAVSFKQKAKTEKRKARARPRRPKTNTGRDCASTRSSGRPTLLQMLLAPEVRHERNVILQCLRYIVKKNFFVGREKAEHQ